MRPTCIGGRWSIAAIGYAADQRAATLAETLRNRVLGLRADLKVARSTLDTQLAAVVAEAQENLWFPSTLVLYTWGDFTENWLFGNPFYNDWMGYWIPPADNYAQMAGFLAGVEADRDDLLAYNTRIARAYADYQAVVDEANRALREIFAMGTQDFQVLERGSDALLYLWSMTNSYAGKMDLVLHELPLTAEVVRPELLTARFDPDRAISRIRARMSELQADYDLDQLQKGLTQVVVLLRDKLSPFWTYNAPDHGFSLLGSVNGIRDYRRSLEETDLFDFASRLQPIWSASQTRLDLLGRHPTLVNSDDISYLTRFGQDLVVYESLIESDRQTRAEAPARAEQLTASLEQTLASLRPVLQGMNPEYYEETLQAYEQTLPTYSMIMPKIIPGASALAGTVGQSLSLEFGIDTPGGTFTSQNDAAGLEWMDPEGSGTGQRLYRIVWVPSWP